ncbi:hypothetical protein HBB16_03710 [Pseudonocardia sp. MCCB 268]|nr:hypothetical protein [Pseudonocardia cytotoxica]
MVSPPCATPCRPRHGPRPGEGLATGPRLIFGGKALSQTGDNGDFARSTTTPALLPAEALICIKPTAWTPCVTPPATSSQGALPTSLVALPEESPDRRDLGGPVHAGGDLGGQSSRPRTTNRYVTVHAPPARGEPGAGGRARCVEHGTYRDQPDPPARRTGRLPWFLTIITYEAMYEPVRHRARLDGSLKKLDEVRTAAVDALSVPTGQEST